jgi:ribonucleoside-diphosphate reductase alpha chain
MTLTDTVQGPTDVAFESVEKTNKTGDYFALNAQLNFWKTDENGKPVVDDNGRKQIPFEKDKEAVKAYFLNHVNPNTQWFTNLGEKLKYLIEEEYYEKAFFDLYDFEFVKKVFKQVYDHNFRFPTFYGAYKYYSAYTLKTFDGQRYLERFEEIPNFA